MNLLKKSSILGLSILFTLIVGILPVIAQEEIETKTINTSIKNDYNYLDKDIILNGVKYNLYYDARDKYSIEGPSAFVKDILSTSNIVRIKNNIKCDEPPFEFNVSHCYFNLPKKPKCIKTCKKLIIANGVEYVGGIIKWTKLEKIVCGKNIASISDVTNCKNLESIKILSNIDYISNIKNCKNLSKVTINNTKKSPIIGDNTFKNTKKGIKFVVKNKKVAKSLKKQLKGSGVRDAKILIGKKVIYKNING